MDRSQNSLENPTGDDLQMVTPPVKNPWYRRRFLLFSFSLLFVLLLLFGYLVFVGYRTYTALVPVMTYGKGLATAIEARDLILAKSQLNETRAALTTAQARYRGLSFARYLPLIGSYVRDGEHAFQAGAQGIATGDLVLSAIEPYADVLGFSGGQALEFTSAEERIIFLAQTVEKLSPQLDEIAHSLGAVSSELEAINPARYPKQFRGTLIREPLLSLRSSVKAAATSLSQFQPFIKLLPDLLGNPEPKRYLVLFQNDAELRPTGGFMTAYATLTIAQGKIVPGVSEDIYTLDNAFGKKIPAPDPIRKYLPLVYNWNLRDMNLSPDFKVSMDTFSGYYKEVSIAPEVDAIVAIDTEVPVRLLRILGPIGVGGYGGQFSADPDSRCDGCPQIIYELENIITRPTYEIRDGRKSILGPLMHSMLANMMGSPKSKWPEFFTVFADSIREKHLLLYFFDAEKQAAVEAMGAAGRVVEYSGDYLHINDTNFAGAKSNLFVEQAVDQTVTIGADGSLTKKLVLTYKNPAPGSNCNLEAGQLCLNGLLRDWIRVYVPKGSVLTAARGFEVDTITSEDLGKTVFESFFTLAPESVKKLELEYTTPAGTISGSEYLLLIQKQPGVGEVAHSLTLAGQTPHVFTLTSDQELVLSR